MTDEYREGFGQGYSTAIDDVKREEQGQPQGGSNAMTESYRVNHGGLLRCCLQSLDDAMVAAEKPPVEGDKLACKYCHDEYGMIFTQGAWRWAAPKPGAGQ